MSARGPSLGVNFPVLKGLLTYWESKILSATTCMYTASIYIIIPFILSNDFNKLTILYTHVAYVYLSHFYDKSVCNDFCVNKICLSVCQVCHFIFWIKHSPLPPSNWMVTSESDALDVRFWRLNTVPALKGLN